MSAEARLKELGLVLPVLAKPVANYLPYRLAGNLLFLAGQGPRDEKGAQEGNDVALSGMYAGLRHGDPFRTGVLAKV